MVILLVETETTAEEVEGSSAGVVDSFVVVVAAAVAREREVEVARPAAVGCAETTGPSCSTPEMP